MTQQIKTILCPNCEKSYLYLQSIDGGKIWVCSECVVVWPHNWFDEFHHLDKFVQLEKDINIEKSLEVIV